MINFNNKFEEQIEKHINDNAYTDRKFSGSIIGTTIFGGAGFLVFNGGIVFPISGGKLEDSPKIKFRHPWLHTGRADREQN